MAENAFAETLACALDIAHFTREHPTKGPHAPSGLTELTLVQLRYHQEPARTLVEFCATFGK